MKYKQILWSILLAQLNSAPIIEIIDLPGNTLATAELEEEPFSHAVKRFDEIFQTKGSGEALCRCIYSNTMADELKACDGMVLSKEIWDRLLKAPYAKLAEKPESRSASRYVLTWIKSKDTMISRFTKDRTILRLPGYPNDIHLTIESVIGTQSVDLPKIDYPAPLSEFLAKIDDFNGIESISWKYDQYSTDNPKLKLELPDPDMSLHKTLECATYSLMDIHLKSILPNPRAIPQGPLVLFDYIYPNRKSENCMPEQSFRSTDKVSRFLELPDGPLDNAQEVLEVLLQSKELDAMTTGRRCYEYAQVIKTGPTFGLYPTLNSGSFKVTEIHYAYYVDNGVGYIFPPARPNQVQCYNKRVSVVFRIRAYDPKNGNLALQTSINTDSGTFYGRTKEPDFFGHDLSDIGSMLDLARFIDKLLDSKYMKIQVICETLLEEMYSNTFDCHKANWPDEMQKELENSYRQSPDQPLLVISPAKEFRSTNPEE